MKIMPYGSSALLVQMEQRIDPATHDKVVRLDEAVATQNWAAVRYTIPAYCSLTIGYDPAVTAFAEMKKAVEALWAQLPPASRRTARRIRIPVSYDDEHALDKERIMEAAQLEWEEVIRLHQEPVYRVYMIGFLPGFPYLGRLPEALRSKRLSVPRKRVPALSVGLAGLQTGIYPFEAPGGWLIIGRAMAPVFEPERREPFLLRAGDEVVFVENRKDRNTARFDYTDPPDR